MTEFDLAIVGAGPAGMAASMAGVKAGAKTLLIDRGFAPGGQVLRTSTIDKSPRCNTTQDRGERLRRDVEAAPLKRMFESTVISADNERTLRITTPDGICTISTNRLILATGARERVVPFTGWTLPGVIGLGALSNVMKADLVVPEGPIVIAGIGPLLYSVAHHTLQLGGKIVAIVDLAPTTEWLTHLPSMLSRPDQVILGTRWILDLRQAGIPFYGGYHVVEAIGINTLSKVVIRRWPIQENDVQKPIEIEASCLSIGHGLQPNTEITRLLGAQHSYCPAIGGWVPSLMDSGETSIKHIYVAGDSGGIIGADASESDGYRVAQHVIRSLQLNQQSPHQWPRALLICRMILSKRFGQAMARLIQPRPDLYRAINSETIICRCEEVSKAKIIFEGQDLFDINAAKIRTRCGMGPCQGRYCEETIAQLLSAAHNRPIADLGYWTARVPLFPLEIQNLVGEYTISDIPLPEPLPS